jgi:hypothetical protein
MPEFPIKVFGKYAYWSTVIHEPTTPFVDSLAALRAIVPDSMHSWSDEQLAVVERIGVPDALFGTGEDVARANRAGLETAGGSRWWSLPLDDLLRAYADTPAGRRRAASNVARIDESFATLVQQLEAWLEAEFDL